MPAAKAVIDQPRIGAMHPDELRGALAARGYRTQAAGALALGVSQGTMSLWLRGKVPIPEMVPVALAGLAFYRPERGPATGRVVTKKRVAPTKSKR